MTEPTPTPEQARAQIDAIRADPKSSYNRGDAGAVEHVQSLYRVLHADTEGGARSVAPAPAAQPVSLEAIETRLRELRTMPADKIRDPAAHVDELMRLGRERETLRAAKPEAGASPSPQAGEQQEWPQASAVIPSLPALVDDEWHEPTVALFLDTAKDIGVSPDDARGFLDTFAGLLGEAPPEDPDDVLQGLKREWGGSFRDNLEAALLVGDRLPESIRAGLEESGLGDHPAVIQWAARVGAPLLAAKREIAKLRADKKHPMHDINDPRHEAGLQELHALYRKVHGSRPVA